MRVGVFHPGTQHSWQTALALQQLGRLAFFATSIFYDPAKWPYKLERIPGRLGRTLHREFSRISKPELDPGLVHTAGVMEWCERIATRAGQRALAHRLDQIGNRHFGSKLRKLLVQQQGRLFLWGYNGSSASSFRIANELGHACILDRTIGDARAYNRTMDELAQSYASWIAPEIRRIDARTIANDDDEYARADIILAGSQFVVDTISSYSPVPDVTKKLTILPYCFDETLFANSPPPRPSDPTKPVRFLFNGAVSARKGIHLALEAFSRIPESAATLTVVGDVQVPTDVLASYRDRVLFTGSVARSEIPAIMCAHDVLLFPSYFEGSALSLLEALACGLAIIQSQQSGIGVTPATGLMLDRLDVDAVHASMMIPIEDRARLDRWRMEAQPHARKYSFACYRENIAKLLTSLA